MGWAIRNLSVFIEVINPSTKDHSTGWIHDILEDNKSNKQLLYFILLDNSAVPKLLFLSYVNGNAYWIVSYIFF